MIDVKSNYISKKFDLHPQVQFAIFIFLCIWYIVSTSGGHQRRENVAHKISQNVLYYPKDMSYPY